jgi:hypothetical protein
MLKRISAIVVIAMIIVSCCNISRSYALDMPISYAQFPGSVDYTYSVNGSTGYTTIVVSGCYYIGTTWQFTAPPNTTIDSLRTGRGYSKNSISLKVNGVVRASGSYVNPNIILEAQNFSNLSATTVSIEGSGVYVAGGIIVGLKANIADGATLNAVKTSADTAATNATKAKTSADAAKTSADSAASRAQTTINQTIDAGNSAAQWSHWSYDKANLASQDTTYIRNTQLPGIDTRINNLQTSVTNIQNGDSVPPTVELDTVSGARATSSSSIQLVAAVGDNKSTNFTYSINGGGYSALPADGKFSVSLTNGPNNIAVRVKDETGNVTVKTINIWRLN